MGHTNLVHYKIIFSKSAEKFLDTLDKQTKLRILEKVGELRSNTENLDIKKLKSHQALYRLRVSHFRVIYTLKQEVIIIYVVAIGHRRDVYQRLNYA